jgi:hypothetical protein
MFSKRIFKAHIHISSSLCHSDSSTCDLDSLIAIATDTTRRQLDEIIIENQKEHVVIASKCGAEPIYNQRRKVM